MCIWWQGIIIKPFRTNNKLLQQVPKKNCVIFTKVAIYQIFFFTLVFYTLFAYLNQVFAFIIVPKVEEWVTLTRNLTIITCDVLVKISSLKLHQQKNILQWNMDVSYSDLYVWALPLHSVLPPFLFWTLI